MLDDDRGVRHYEELAELGNVLQVENALVNELELLNALLLMNINHKDHPRLIRCKQILYR